MPYCPGTQSWRVQWWGGDFPRRVEKYSLLYDGSGHRFPQEGCDLDGWEIWVSWVHLPRVILKSNAFSYSVARLEL